MCMALWASHVALVGKNPPANAGDMRQGFDSRVEKITWKRKWKTTPAFLPGEFQGQRSPAGYSPWGPLSIGSQLKQLSTYARGPLLTLYYAYAEYLWVRSPQEVSRTFEVLWTELFKIYSPKSTWSAYNSASWRHNHRAELYIPYAKGAHWTKRCINVCYAEKSDVNFLTCSQWESADSVTVNMRFPKN